MIVKVQVALNSAVPLVFIYDRRRKFEYHGPMDADLAELMAGRVKAFFLAEIDDQKRFSIGEEAAWQTW